jgi:hypothetical protein
MHVKGSSIPKEKLDSTETRKLVKSVRPVAEKSERCLLTNFFERVNFILHLKLMIFNLVQ